MWLHRRRSGRLRRSGLSGSWHLSLGARRRDHARARSFVRGVRVGDRRHGSGALGNRRRRRLKAERGFWIAAAEWGKQKGQEDQEAVSLGLDRGSRAITSHLSDLLIFLFPPSFGGFQDL